MKTQELTVRTGALGCLQGILSLAWLCRVALKPMTRLVRQAGSGISVPIAEADPLCTCRAAANQSIKVRTSGPQTLNALTYPEADTTPKSLPSLAVAKPAVATRHQRAGEGVVDTVPTNHSNARGPLGGGLGIGGPWWEGLEGGPQVKKRPDKGDLH